MLREKEDILQRQQKKVRADQEIIDRQIAEEQEKLKRLEEELAQKKALLAHAQEQRRLDMEKWKVTIENDIAILEQENKDFEALEAQEEFNRAFAIQTHCWHAANRPPKPKPLDLVGAGILRR